MALVSQSIIDEWFKKTSWVYKNFAYLFQNQIWNKKIPNGFSLCPYFWTAMFSMCIFRPIIIPLLLSLKGISYLLKPAWGLLRVTDNLVEKYTPIDVSGCNAIGVPTILGLFFLSGIGMVLFLSTLISYKVFVIYLVAQALPALIIPLILAASTITLGVYKYKTGTECKVESYNRLLVIVGTAIAITMMTKEFVMVISAIKEFIVFCFEKFVWALSTFFGAIFNGIIATLTNPLLLIPIIGLLLTGIIGYFMSKYGLMDKIFNNIDKAIIEEENRRRTLRHGKTEYDFVVYMVSDKMYKMYNYGMSFSRTKDFLKYFDYSKYLDDFYKNEDYSIFNTMANDFQDHINRVYEERNKKEMAREKRCIEMTNRLSYVFGVLCWPFRQLKIFFVMMIEIIKSRKQGFCPYKKFTD